MYFIFDFEIIFTLLFSGYWMYVIVRSFFYHKDKKNALLAHLIPFVILMTIFLAIFIGSFVLPQLFVVNRVNLNYGLTAPHENIKIAFISDMHMGRYKQTDYIKKIATAIEKENPDLLILGGDYILGNGEYAKYLEPISKLSAKIPTYAVIGNHENGQKFYLDPNGIDKTKILRESFRKWGITILENANQTINIQNNQITIAGVKDLYSGKENLEATNKNLPTNNFKILVSHNPDILINEKSGIYHLILSGHTHGGQIRLPWIGPVPQMGTKLGKTYDEGLFPSKNGYLFISRSIGESGPRARFFSQPEIDLLNVDL